MDFLPKPWYSKSMIKTLLFIPILLCAEINLPTTFDPQAAVEQGLRDIAILNRPLVKVNGNQISLIDVMKKMNTFLYEHYPEALSDNIMMYQFYSSRWRATLDEMINNELMLLEAETKEITVSDGDVREEVEKRFGPNIMASLNEIGISLEEARTLIHTELLVQRIMWMNVHQKAMQEITPKKVKEAYAIYLKEHPQKEFWTYQFISVRGGDKELGEKIAKQGAELSCTHTSIEKVHAALLDSFKDTPNLPKITLSEEVSPDVKSISDMHKQALASLSDKQYSEPKKQISRTGDEVWRIFQLKDREIHDPANFNQVSERIKNQLMQERSAHYAGIYFEGLREQYHLTDQDLAQNIPEDYTPFHLK